MTTIAERPLSKVEISALGMMKDICRSRLDKAYADAIERLTKDTGGRPAIIGMLSARAALDISIEAASTLYCIEMRIEADDWDIRERATDIADEVSAVIFSKIVDAFDETKSAE